MISFSLDGVKALEHTKKFVFLENKISILLENIHKKNQGFYSDEVLYNKDVIDEIDYFVREHSQKQYLVILGIGGSALGGIALQKMLASHTKKNVFFLDTLYSEKIIEVLESISLSTTLFVVMSKSGGTTEVLSLYLFFLNKILEKKYSIPNHFAFVTGNSGFLREEGEKRGIKMFTVPENVGGRFSVLTSIGLIPARFMGIDIHSLLDGALEMRKNFFEKDPKKNIAFQLATVQGNALKSGVTKNVMYSYSNFLCPLADWYRQLLAESTGKKFSKTGEEIFTGITPINSSGVKDHHSQNQLYMEGPFDTLICFLETNTFSCDISIPNLGYTEQPLSFLQGKKFSDVLIAEREASKKALTESGRPWVAIRVPEIIPKYIGQLFLFFEASVAFLGEMMNINAFDQPGVERTKIITKEILQKS